MGFFALLISPYLSSPLGLQYTIHASEHSRLLEALLTGEDDDHTRGQRISCQPLLLPRNSYFLSYFAMHPAFEVEHSMHCD